jgi:hypothetical protein
MAMSKRAKAAKAGGSGAVAQPVKGGPGTAANASAAQELQAVASPVARSFPPVPARSGAPSPSNVGVAWKGAGSGAGVLLVSYEGPLAAAEVVQARTGTLRAGGAPWGELRDVRLTCEKPGRYVGVITVPSGAPVEAVELAFHAGDAWDNGGLAPLGYYEWNTREQRIAVR